MGIARLVLLVSAVFLAVACSNGDGGREDGQDAERYFAAWAEAWSSGDPYETASFYAHDVTMSLAQPDLELSNSAAFWDTTTQGDGRAWLAAWLLPQTIHTRLVDELFIGADNAVAIITIDDVATAAWVEMQMRGTGIAEQSMLRWRDAHKPSGAPDVRLAWVDRLVADYLAAWSAGDDTLLEDLYTADATIQDGTASPVAVWSSIVPSETLALPAVSLTDVASGGRLGPAIFVVPRIETETVAMVVDTEVDGCRARTAVLLTQEGRRIVSERRLHSVETLRRCFADRLAVEGWWTDLEIPLPLDEQVSSMVVGTDGREISIVNGTPELERLLAWGLGRFSSAGLDVPIVESVSFAPVPSCAGLGGVVLENDAGAPDLVLCTDAYSACLPDATTCTEFERSARFGLLHELAHVWLVENLDGDDEAGFTAASGAAAWRDGAAPWHRRGVERAAEVMAWGLMDEPVQLVRLENPSCADAEQDFVLLTGARPLVGCRSSPLKTRRDEVDS